MPWHATVGARRPAVRLSTLGREVRDKLRAYSERLAEAHGLANDFIQGKNFRKEDRLKVFLAQREHHPGVGHRPSSCANW